jgi:hypothetical protein
MGDVERDPLWLFPAYASKSGGGCESKINNILRQLHKDGVTSELYTSHAFRVGATDDLVMNNDVPYFSVTARGDWYMKGECMVYHYISRPLHVTKAGTYLEVHRLLQASYCCCRYANECAAFPAKALAGWKDINARVHPPSLAVIEVDDRLRAFITMLFDFVPKEINEPLLVQFRDVIVAELVMTFEDMTKRYPKCAVVAVMRDHMKKCRLKEQEIISWGAAIGADYIAKNFAAGGNNTNDSLKRQVVTLAEGVQGLSQQVSGLQNGTL